MPKALLRLAILGKPKGLKGELHATLTTDDPAWLAGAGEVWIARLGDKPEKIEIERAGAVGDRLVVKFKGVDNRDAAEALKGFEVLVDSRDLPELENGRFWVHEVIGYRVVDETRGDIGSLKSVMETGANDCFEVVPEQGESFLVPLTEQTFKGVDNEGQCLRVDLLPGSVPGDEE